MRSMASVADPRKKIRWVSGTLNNDLSAVVVRREMSMNSRLRCEIEQTSSATAQLMCSLTEG